MKVMKKYSCNQAQKGKTAFRTPDRFIYKKVVLRSRFKSNSRKYFNEKKKA